MLSKLSVKKPYTVVVAVIIVLILGSISFINLKTDLLPKLDLPFLVISTSYPGASPEEVEMLVTRPIEQIVARTSNIENINSISSENSSTVIMEFGNDVNIDSAIIEINGNLDLIKGGWDDSIGSPMIIRLNPDMLPIMISSVDIEDMEISEISSLVRDNIIPELESVTGVAAVDGTGLLEERVEVSLNQEKIDSLNKRMLKKLDSELSSAEDKLKDAKREIEKGKSELDSQESFKLDELKFAQDTIKNGKDQLQEGKIGIDNALRELKNKKAELISAKKDLDKKEKELLVLKNSIRDAGVGLSPEQAQMLESAIAGLAAVDEGKQEIENGLLAIEININELEDKKLEINNQIVDLGFKEQEVARGKIVLSNEINRARAELKSGEKLLDQNIEEFEKNKEEALKNGALEGVIDKKMISGVLMAQNFSMPAGYLDESEYLVKVGDKLDSLDEMKGLLLFDTGEEAIGKVYLTDVADIEYKDNSKEIYAKVNGNNAVILKEGAREVAGAIIASTFTTACVFLPIVFTKGISRQLFSDMGLTIAYSLFASLIVALTVVPTMSSTILKETKEKKTNMFDKFSNFYEKVLEGAFNHRIFIMLSVTILLGLSGYLSYNMGTSFIPQMESTQMDISLKMPEESALEDTIKESDKFIEKIGNIEGIKTVGAFQNSAIGGGFAPSRVDNLNMNFYLLLDEEKNVDNSEIAKEIEKITKDLNATITINTSKMDMTALGGSGIEIVVKGREIDNLNKIAQDVEDILKKTEGTEFITSGSGEGIGEIRLKVDKEKAMENGFTTAQVFSEINNLLEGAKKAIEITVNDRDYPVIVIEDENLTIDKDSLLEFELEDKNGEKFKVKEIVDVIEQEGVSSITRELQERFISVKADLKEGYNIGLVSREIEKELNNYDTPEGYSVRITGENETINESIRDLILMLSLSVVFIYLIMVAQFQSLLSPFIVMFTIPLAFTGGLLALWITGNNISLIAMLGFLVLSGVVVNNGIVFVDYTNLLRKRGVEKRKALIITGKTRLRPILMTAITTILGLLPLAIGVGTGSEMLQPLAIVAVGGLIYATILTLIVVPVIYDLLNRKDLIIRGGKNER